MIEYLDISIVNTFRQTFGGFGIIYTLAFVLWLVSRMRRHYGAGIMGRAESSREGSTTNFGFVLQPLGFSDRRFCSDWQKMFRI